MARRYDRRAIRTDAFTRTPAGSLVVQAELTSAGVFSYTDADGKVYREYRPASELAKADSLATLEDVAVTIGHPRGGVGPDSYARLSAGHVRAGTPKADGAVVAGQLVIARKDAIEGVASGAYAETSMGYDCDVVDEPGVTPEGVAYDRIQRNYQWNHIALLKRGDSRLGTKLRLDSKGDEMVSDPGVSEEHDPEEAAPLLQEGLRKLSGHNVTVAVKMPSGNSGKMNMKYKKADGSTVEVEKGSDEHIALLEAERDQARADSASASTELARRDAEAATAARSALESKAKALGVEVKDGMSDRDLRVAAITKSDPTFKADGRDDTYVTVRFDMIAEKVAAPPPRGSHPVVTAALGTGPEVRVDALDELQATAAKLESNALKAWERN